MLHRSRPRRAARRRRPRRDRRDGVGRGARRRPRRAARTVVARHVADGEVRRNATVGGNICSTPGDDSQRGDLGGPLIALGARVRSTGAGGERTEPIEDFLDGRPHRAPRARGRLRPVRAPHRREQPPPPPRALVLDRRRRRLLAGRTAPTCASPSPASARRPFAAGASSRAATPPTCCRTCSPSTTPSPRPPTAAPSSRTSSAKPSTTWSAHEADRQRRRAGDREPAAHAAPARPAGRARHHEPEGRLPAGRLRHVHRPRRRRAAPLLPDGGGGGRRRVDHDRRGNRRGRGALGGAGRVLQPLRRAVRVLHARA